MVHVCHTFSTFFWTLVIILMCRVEASLSTAAPQALALYKGFWSQLTDPGPVSQVCPQVFTAHPSASGAVSAVGVAVAPVVNQATN